MSCTRFGSSTKKTCIKDRKKFIIREARETPSTTGGNMQTSYTDLLTVYGMVKTKAGVQSFDGINVADVTNTDFIVPYSTSLGAIIHKRLSILFQDKIFDIIRTENIDYANESIKFVATERGDSTKRANF